MNYSSHTFYAPLAILRRTKAQIPAESQGQKVLYQRYATPRHAHRKCQQTIHLIHPCSPDPCHLSLQPTLHGEKRPFQNQATPLVPQSRIQTKVPNPHLHPHYQARAHDQKLNYPRSLHSSSYPVEPAPHRPPSDAASSSSGSLGEDHRLGLTVQDQV